MNNKSVLIVVFLTLITGISFSQRVKRNGVEPMDVSKNKRTQNLNSSRFQISQLNGKWQETSRSTKNNIPVKILDTVYLNFTGNSKVITRDGNNANIIGVAVIESGNVLLAASDIYTIVSVTDSVIILDNQENLLHSFKKTAAFYFESFGKLSVTQEEFTEPVSVTNSAIIGNWSIYKRVAKPGTINPPVNIIITLKITEAINEDKAMGEITFYQTDKSETLPCSIKITNIGIEIISGQNVWSLLTYKITEKEFVFGDAAMMLYYARRM